MTAIHMSGSSHASCHFSLFIGIISSDMIRTDLINPAFRRFVKQIMNLTGIKIQNEAFAIKRALHSYH